MKKALNLFVVTIAALVVATSQAHAGASVSQCQMIYGGGEVCPPSIKFTLDKKVQNPTSGAFVDNLGVNDPKYKASQKIAFKITITNTGTAAIENVTITDTLPQFIGFDSGSGNFDKATNKFSVTINKLEVGQSKTFDLVGRAADAKTLPQDKGMVCPINTADARENKGTAAQDSAQVCIEREVTTGKGGPVVQPPVKVTTTPQTGPEMFALTALIPTGAVGFFLRRKSKVS